MARKKPLPELTTGLPGTEAKIAALCERRRRRQQLWNPADAGHKAQMGRISGPNNETVERTGVYRDRTRYRARVWCGRLCRQLDLGLFQDLRQAEAAVTRARALLV
jgi:hypothetical protein